MEPSGRNRWQPAASRTAPRTAQIRENRCRGLRPVASEAPWQGGGLRFESGRGLYKSPANRALLMNPLARSSARDGYGAVHGAPRFRGRSQEAPKSRRGGVESGLCPACDACPPSSSREGPTIGVDPKVSCEVGPCPDPLRRGDRGKRPVQDGGGARVLIHASCGTQLCCQKAVGRKSGPRTGQERGHRVSTRSLYHVAPPVDHLPVGGGAQLLVSMLDDAVFQPGLSG
jgi:hypothetical protein